MLFLFCLERKKDWLKSKNENVFSRLSETFDRFEIELKLGDEMLVKSSDKVHEMEKARTSNESDWRATARIQPNISKLGEQHLTEWINNSFVKILLSAFLKFSYSSSIVEVDNESHLFVNDVGSDIVNKNVSIKEESMDTAYAPSPAIQIDDSDDEEVVLGTIETEPVDITATVGNFASQDEIESVMIATQNTSGAHNSNNG